MTTDIIILNGTGHLSLTWDPGIPESVERAHRDYEQLIKDGYQFFYAISRQPADAFDPLAGALEIVRRIKDPSEIEPKVVLAEPVPPVQAEPEPPRRGRRGKRTEPTERVVAARPMRGG